MQALKMTHHLEVELHSCTYLLLYTDVVCTVAIGIIREDLVYRVSINILVISGDY